MTKNRVWIVRDDLLAQCEAVMAVFDRWCAITAAGISDETGIDEYYLISVLLPHLCESGRLERFREANPALPGGPIKYFLYRRAS